MKEKIFLIAIFILFTLTVGCSKSNDNVNDLTTENLSIDNKSETDVISSASVATDEASLHKAFEESWIIILKNDIVTDKELTLQGDFTKPDKEDPTKMVPAGRNISLYDHDENRNKTVTYTLTSPKLIIRSNDTKIKGGNFIGDIYVEANGFNLVDTQVEGNVIFSKAEYKETYEIDQKSTVTGVQEVQELLE